jgi:hypothetical protein
MRVLLFFVAFAFVLPVFAGYKPAPERDYCEYAESLSKLHDRFDLGPFTFLGFRYVQIPEECTKNWVKQNLLWSFKYIPDSEFDEIEASVLTSYVGSGFRIINRTAISSELSKRNKIIQVMDRALSKIPNYNGIVYEGNRGLDASQFKPGMVLLFKGYLSTSYRWQIATNFAAPKGVIFRIHVKNGKDLSETFNPIEKEILVPRGSRFRVTGFIKKHGIKMVMLEQIGDFPYEKPPIKKRIKKYLIENYG